MMATVQPANVQFAAPALTQPEMRELTPEEIEWIAGAIDHGEVLESALVGAGIGAVSVGAGGAAAGAIFGPGAAVGFGAGFVSGGVGGFVGGALKSIADQTGFS